MDIKKGSSVIDSEGYRHGVAIVLLNQRGQVFWGKRIKQDSWQFPQGGIHREELTLAALYRELWEEVGLFPHHVEVVASTDGWLRYSLPVNLQRVSQPTCIGQKQKWFLLSFLGEDSDINLFASYSPEFDGWKWVDYSHPSNHVVDFKRDIYRKALDKLSEFVCK